MVQHVCVSIHMRFSVSIFISLSYNKLKLVELLCGPLKIILQFWIILASLTGVFLWCLKTLLNLVDFFEDILHTELLVYLYASSHNLYSKTFYSDVAKENVLLLDDGWFYLKVKFYNSWHFCHVCLSMSQKTSALKTFQMNFSFL